VKFAFHFLYSNYIIANDSNDYKQSVPTAINFNLFDHTNLKDFLQKKCLKFHDSAGRI